MEFLYNFIFPLYVATRGALTSPFQLSILTALLSLVSSDAFPLPHLVALPPCFLVPLPSRLQQILFAPFEVGLGWRAVEGG